MIGTDDQVSVRDWYTDSAHQLDTFSVSEGSKQMRGYQVEQLVSAMAAFSAPPAGQFELAGERLAAISPVLAAVWY